MKVVGTAGKNVQDYEAAVSIIDLVLAFAPIRRKCLRSYRFQASKSKSLSWASTSRDRHERTISKAGEDVIVTTDRMEIRPQSTRRYRRRRDQSSNSEVVKCGTAFGLQP